MDYKIYVDKKLIIETNNYLLMKKIARKKIQEYDKKRVSIFYKDKKTNFI